MLNARDDTNNSSFDTNSLYRQTAGQEPSDFYSRQMTSKDGYKKDSKTAVVDPESWLRDSPQESSGFDESLEDMLNEIVMGPTKPTSPVLCTD